ncbi:MAG: hypothetical protein ACUVQP_01380 [Bacteroidales bacterium]
MKYLYFLILIFIVTAVKSQNETPKYIRVKYTYIVENVQSESQLQKLEAELKAIREVDDVKYTYKPEKQMAQYIIYTTQKVRQSEGDEEFHITSLKRAIIKNELLPNEFKEEIIEK